MRICSFVVLLPLLAFLPATQAAEAEPDGPIIGIVSADPNEWTQIRIVDVWNFPWDEEPRFRSRTKTIFRGPSVGTLTYSIRPPTWDSNLPVRGKWPHYHLWSEWSYTLRGDGVRYEYVSPDQKNGLLYQKTEGSWMERPPYSLHGGTWITDGGLRLQNPYHILVFEEGDGSIVNTGPNGDHIFPGHPDRRPDPYQPDWQSVGHFNVPWMINSIELEWEPDPAIPGRFVKWLSDNSREGFRARLIKIPPGWTPPPALPRTYFEEANRLRFMLYGDMTVWSFESPESQGKERKVKQDYFIYQPPRSIWGYGSDLVTELGAIWLEVTYATGLSHGSGPIEEPIPID